MAPCNGLRSRPLNPASVQTTSSTGRPDHGRTHRPTAQGGGGSLQLPGEAASAILDYNRNISLTRNQRIAETSNASTALHPLPGYGIYWALTMPRKPKILLAVQFNPHCSGVW